MTTAPWTDAPYVFVEAIACPYCGATRPITIRSESGGDGSIMRKSVCRRCSKRFRVVIENALPEFGNDDFPMDTLTSRRP